MTYALALFFSVLLTTVLVPPLMKFAFRTGMVDVPDARKVHSSIIPRSGGLAVIIGALVPLFFLVPSKPLVLGICLGGVFILIEAIVDDVWGLSYRIKFVGQILAAAVTIYASDLHFTTLGELLPGCKIECGILGYPLTVFFLVATTNIINLSDGLDGLAGGICILIFASTGFLAFLGRDFTTLAFCVCMVGSIVGFLRYNSYPALVFLGDTGSQFLGFMVGITLLLFTTGSTHQSPIMAMYLIGIPVLDTLLAVIQRALEKRPLFKPDKSHLHHRLLRLGLKHHQAVTAIYITQFVIILIGWSLPRSSDAVLFGVYLCLIGFFLAVVLFPMVRLSRRFAANGHLNGVLHEIEEKGKNPVFLSRQFISKAAWGLLLGSMLVFFFFSPLWMRPISHDVGLCSLGLIFVLAFVRFMRPGFFLSVTKIAGYFLAIYYIVILDISTNSPQLLWDYDNKWFLTGIFIVIGGSYLLYLITTFEKLPIIPMDYLLLGVVVLTFLLPETYRREFHMHTIAARILLIFLSLELVAFKLKDKLHAVASAVFPSLGLNFFMAFWPWLI